MTNNHFEQKDAYGSTVQRAVEDVLTQRGISFECIDGTDARQAFGDLRLTRFRHETYVEVKGNRFYDAPDPRHGGKNYDLYFEVFEGYRSNYTNKSLKAGTLELVGVLNQLAFEDTARTIFVHKLGSIDRWLVYTPASILAYFTDNDSDHITSWRRSLIQSQDADGQVGKFKLGAHIGNVHERTLDARFPTSPLGRFSQLVDTAHLPHAVIRASKSFTNGGSPDTEFRTLMRSFHGERWLDQQEWAQFPVGLRKQLAA